MLKKIIISLFLATYLLTNSLVPVVRAEETTGTWYNQGYDEWSTKVFDKNNPQEIFGERYVFAQVQWIIYSLAAILSGTDLLECAKDLDNLPECIKNLAPAEQTSSIQNPAIGIAVLNDALMSNKPASGIKYLHQKAANLKIVPETHAQEGFGFSSIAPVQKIWKATRDMSYFLLILVVLGMAFMIMFRVKISPQAVITVQSALPKIVGILLLITFSYAIAGLVIDLSYLLIALVALFAKNGGLAGGLSPEIGSLVIAQRMWGTAAWPLASLVVLVTLPPILLLTGGLGIAALTGATLPVIGQIAGGAVGTTFLILIIALFVFIIITLFRIFWTMLKAFINILMLIIFGPFLILLGGISTSGTIGFSSWLRNLAANVAVFPTIAIMGFLAHLFYWSRDNWWLNLFREGSWLNPFEINSWISGEFAFPVFSPGTSLTPLLIGLGILFLMPSAAKLIKSVIAGQPFAYGTAIGEALGPIVFAGRGGLQYGVQEIEAGKLASFERQHPRQKYPGWWLANLLRKTKTIG